MAFVDAKLLFSDAQSLVLATAAAINSTNVIDLGAASPNIGRGTPIWAHVRIGTACTGQTSTTLAVALKHCATVDGSYTDLISYSAASIANFTAGLKVIEQALPSTVHRYLKVVYTVGTSAVTAGTVDAWLNLSEMESV